MKYHDLSSNHFPSLLSTLSVEKPYTTSLEDNRTGRNPPVPQQHNQLSNSPKKQFKHTKSPQAKEEEQIKRIKSLYKQNNLKIKELDTP